MSSLLTNFVRKRYNSIDLLDDQYKINPQISIIQGNLYKGFIHSIYIKLDEEDFTKLYTYYNLHHLLDNQSYIMYSNNVRGVLAYGNKKSYKYNVEKWDFEHSVVYNYPSVDVAYVIDKFSNRMVIEAPTINNVSLRLNSYGNCCKLDSNVTMFLGRRVINKIYDKNLEFINQKDRLENRCVNLEVRSARSSRNIIVAQNVYEDLYVIFRSVNFKTCAYNKKDIKKFLCTQKLDHLVNVKTNFLEPIT